MRKEYVKARKQIKAKANWRRKIEERGLNWFAWFNWVEAKKKLEQLEKNEMKKKWAVEIPLLFGNKDKRQTKR